MLGIDWCSRYLASEFARSQSAHEMLGNILSRNQFDIQIQNENLIPKDGGCIIATNHPHGFFDGLGGIWLAGKHGHDARTIARHFLSVIEPLKEICLFVKISADRKSDKGEQIAEQASAFIRDGGRLAICSAGRLSYSKPIWKLGKDLPWKTGTVRISQKSDAPIVLVHMAMRHSITRQLAQRIHPIARALLQIWSFRFGRSQQLHMKVLAVVYPKDIPNGTVQEQTVWLQAKFNELADQPE